MADSIIRQGFRALNSGGWHSLSDDDLVKLHQDLIKEIRRREKERNIDCVETQDDVEYLLSKQSYEPCSACAGLATKEKPCDNPDCMDGVTFVNNDDFYESYVEELKAAGAEIVFLDYFRGTQKDLEPIYNAIRILGGGIFQDPLSEDLPGLGFVLQVPKILRDGYQLEIKNESS